MKRTDFLQAKMTFLIRYPQADELTFYHSFTEHHPQEAIGWLYYGQEWEKRGMGNKALEAYRKGLHSSNQEDASGLRDAYQILLRKQKRKKLLKNIRLRAAFLFIFITLLLLFPKQIAEEAISNPQPNNLGKKTQQHTEVIAVPEQLSAKTLELQVKKYVHTRRADLSIPFTVVVVPETEGLPLYTPLLFYTPRSIKGIVQFDPKKRQITFQKWFTPSCSCEQDNAIKQIRGTLATEQRALEHVLLVRNALYRYYQKHQRLPKQLSELAGAFPTNDLPAIPNRTVTRKTAKQQTTTMNYQYNPSAHQANLAWESMRNVVPLVPYPEPMLSLSPLQIVIYQESYTMSLMSGFHVVRQYPIGIGKNNSTPEGLFTITQKINHPKSIDPGVYGLRGLVIANSYAIHGTNHPESIRQALSLGCIRLFDPDVEELYTFVSPGTEVIISQKKTTPLTWSNPPRNTISAGPEEDTPKVIYHWLH